MKAYMYRVHIGCLVELDSEEQADVLMECIRAAINGDNLDELQAIMLNWPITFHVHDIEPGELLEEVIGYVH